jgi:ankyrin repeat protein
MILSLAFYVAKFRKYNFIGHFHMKKDSSFNNLNVLNNGNSPDWKSSSPNFTPLVDKSPRSLYFNSKGKFDSQNFKLIMACSIGNLNLVKKYINEEKIDPCSADYDQRTALHLAAQQGHLEVVEFLISKVSNLNEVDKYGLTPIRCAMNSNHLEVVELLRKFGGKTCKLRKN